MSKVISSTTLTETLSLTECKDGFWLYDRAQGWNISMRAKTAQDAFVEALTYYQKRFKETNGAYKSLKEKVDAFVVQFEEPEDYLWWNNRNG